MESNFCQTCLSKDRRLIPQKRIEHLLQETLDVELYGNHGICWECHHIMLKYFNFKLRVGRAQELIQCLGQKSQSLSKLVSISKDYFDYQFYFDTDPLTSELDHIKIEIKEEDTTDSDENICDESKSDENEPQDDTKPNVAVEVYVHLPKANPIPVCKATDNDINDRHLECNINAYINNSPSPKLNCKADASAINLRNEVKKVEYGNADEKLKRKKTKKELETEVAELKSKFATLMYSYEEMEKEREDKRNRPNFKRLPFKCDSCVLGFTRQHKLDEHMEKKHNKKLPYSCDICLTRFPYRLPLAQHVTTHFTRYRCRLCPYEATEMWCALNHSRLKHSTDAEGRHGPNNDDESSKLSGKCVFICDMCNKKFKSKDRLESHIVTHNPALVEKLAYCATCDIQYKNIYVYRNHLKKSAKHSGRPYPCSECNKTFVAQVYLNKHYNFYHLKKSKHNCDICNKICISNWRLKVHKQVHHGLTRPRNYACDICGKEFFTPAMLRSHRLTHSAARSFMCEDCGDTFKQSAALYTHTRRVHRLK